MDRGAWWAAVHGVTESGTWLSDFTFTFHYSLSCIGEGNGNPLQCSCLENPKDGGAWWATVYGVTQSQTRLKWLSSSSSNIHCGPKHTGTSDTLTLSRIQIPSIMLLCHSLHIVSTFTVKAFATPHHSTCKAVSAKYFLYMNWFNFKGIVS